MEDLQFKLDQFEGPLDLLLTLIAKHKMNIFDIEISSLLEQYMAYLNEAQRLDMEIAGEFLEMASRLIHIKTVSLLPKHEEGDELKKELTGELIEYGLCKAAGRVLGEQYCGSEIFVRKPLELPVDKTYQGVHTKEQLLEALLAINGKAKIKQPPSQQRFTPIVAKRIVSVASRIIFVLKELYRNSTVRFKSLFQKNKSRSEMVATFLAVLELIKAGRLNENDGEITMNHKKGARRRDH